jgi:hypothetical protein
LVPDGDYLVDARETLGQGGDRAELVALRSGRDRRWLLAREAGAVALLASRPDTADLDRALAMHGGKRVERATVELLPGN